MATYKVLQDIEAEDKFLGPLTLKQFILAAITGVGLYLSVIAFTKGIWLVGVMLLPIELVTGFLAFPWGRDQPTEVWLLAKLRYFLKPRKRIWDQTGIQELVKITAPKKIEENLTNGLTNTEVKSRLKALADTIDSRGWVIKNVEVNMFAQPAYGSVGNSTDRLVALSSMPQQVVSTDVTANDDIFENQLATQLDQQIAAATAEHQQIAVSHMQQAANDASTNSSAANFWFMEQPSITPGGSQFGTQITAKQDGAYLPKDFHKKDDVSDEQSQALLEKVHKNKAHEHESFRNHRRVEPFDPSKSTPTAVTGAPPADILNLAIDNNRKVDSLAREAQKNHPEQPPEPPDNEVIIPLH